MIHTPLRWAPAVTAVLLISAAHFTSSTLADGWFAWAPKPDPLTPESAIDLRFLNEKFAGENGRIEVKDGRFVHSQSLEPVRFWAVNGPPHDLRGDDLKRCARVLAKYGVNLVRVHTGYFDKKGEVDARKIAHAHEIVQAMKAEGIYTHFSIYFPLWITPQPDNPWLKGYDGKQHPFAALLFNPDFQAQYRQWWTALLTTRNETTGQRLIDEPAVMGVELQNEDSFFFWTFSEKNLPPPQLERLEKQFGDWLAARYGSINSALANWAGPKLTRDAPDEGRIAFRPLWNVFTEKSARDQDTVRFLFELQTRFYSDTREFLRRLGFKGLVTTSNWSTASPEVLGPVEKLSYTTGDFIDRHGYFSCNHKGDAAEWSIRNGHTYAERSALRFDAEVPGAPKQFVHPVMDPHYAGKPSMISETTWTRPNRHRSEAPLYLAAYGALQGSDAIIHFAFDSAHWAVKPGFWMQPWTLMTPAMMGQFPAAALIYRRGLIKEGAVLARVELNQDDLLKLRGTPLPQEAALDELRLKDLPLSSTNKPGQRLDPLLHYAGRVEVTFSTRPKSVRISSAPDLIDHTGQRVDSCTGELHLDYGKGQLKIDAPFAQGVSGHLSAAGSIETADLRIESDLELGHIVAVALDQQPIGKSNRILLQVMSEEQTTGFSTAVLSPGIQRIISIGQDPWQVRELRGRVRFKRSDASELKVTALDENGYASGRAGTAAEIELGPRTVYYLVSR